MVGGVYDADIKPWEGKGLSSPPNVMTVSDSLLPGGIITSYSTTFENLDGAGHGVKLEPTSMIVRSCDLVLTPNVLS